MSPKDVVRPAAVLLELLVQLVTRLAPPHHRGHLGSEYERRALPLETSLGLEIAKEMTKVDVKHSPALLRNHGAIHLCA